MEKTPRRIVGGIAALPWLSLLLPLYAWSQTLKQAMTIDLPGPKGDRSLSGSFGRCTVHVLHTTRRFDEEG